MVVETFWDLERIGRIRLSRNFFLRDFLHSEIASFYRLPNWPGELEAAVVAGGNSAPRCWSHSKRPLGASTCVRATAPPS